MNPIEPKRISKSTNSLTKSSLVKAGLVFLGTVGAYYLAKTTGIFSHFGWGTKNSNSKNVGNSEIMKLKNAEKSLTVKMNSEITSQANNPSLNRISKTYRNKDRTVEFEEIKVKEFKDSFETKKENVDMQRSFSRRSINVQNPIPNQNATFGEFFELTIDGTSVFSSNSSILLDATNIPTWLTSYCNPIFKGSYDTPDQARGVVISGNYAYVADCDSGLQIIDISDPSNPTFKGSYDTPAYNVYEAAVFGNYAYLSSGFSGLQIIDITDPSNPTFKGSYRTPGQAASGVTLSGNYAYVADGDSGLQIVDISNPASPTFKGSYDTPGRVFEVALSGNYAYVADYESGLYIIDISDPANPTFKGSYNTNARRVAVSGNYAYVADHSYYSSGLQVIDISDPSNPTLKGSYYPLYAYDVHGVAVSGNYAYVAIVGLQIIDISDPANPTFKGSYPTNAQGVAVSGNYAYVAADYSGLQIIAIHSNKLTLSGTPSSLGTDSVDVEACNEIMECVSDSFDITIRDNALIVTNPIPDQNATVGKLFELTIDRTFVFSSSSALFEATNIPPWLVPIPLNLNPAFKGSYDTPGSSDGVAISGNYAYVADDWGDLSSLQIIDISDPSNPTFKGSYDTLFGNSHEVVVISGNYAYVAAGDSGLQIVDVSDPSNPTFKGLYDHYARGVALSENYAYVTGGGLQIIDISDPSNPTFKSSYNDIFLNGIYEVAVSGNYACVADLWGASEIVDISNPSNPTFKGGYYGLYGAEGIVMSSNYVYVADSWGGLKIIDITNPTNPTLKGSYGTSREARGVALSGSYAYMVSDSGLQIIDISDPENPTLKESYYMPVSLYTYGIAVSGNYVYVANGSDGLQIIALNPDKLILSGKPNSIGTYGVNITACNEIMGCIIDSFDITVGGNNVPIVANPIQNQTAIINTLFNYVFPTNTFFDPDGHSLTYTAKSSDDSPLPSWLNFNSFQREFSGMPNALTTYSIEVIANDGYNGSVSNNFDIAVKNNDNPLIVANPIPDQSATVGKLFELTIDGNHVFSPSSSLSLDVPEIPNWLMLTPLNPNPTFKGSYDTPSLTVKLALSGNYAYLGVMDSGLQIIDISDPANPTFRGSYDTPDEAIGIAVSGNYAYVAAGDSALQIIDISDPSNPTFKGSYDALDYASDVTLSGDYAYVADLSSGLQIIDVSDSSNPTFKGSYDALDYASDVVVSGNYAYVACRTSGLQIIDISDLSNPTFKNSYDTPGFAYEAVVSGNYAFVADWFSGLQIIDISDPSNPTFKGSYNGTNSAFAVALSGNYAYVAAGDSGLQIIDISDPGNPTFKSSYDTPEMMASGVALSGNYAYVVERTDLQIIALNPDKLILSGTPSSIGTYSIDIEACNEIMECTSDSFEISVNDSDDTTDTIVDTMDTTDTTSITDTTDLTTTSIIISSMTIAACVACITSFSLPLIIGGGIVMLRRSRNKTLRDKSNTNAIKQKKEEVEQKVLVSKEDIELEVLSNSTE
jgi:hypothetical protein